MYHDFYMEPRTTNKFTWSSDIFRSDIDTMTKKVYNLHVIKDILYRGIFLVLFFLKRNDVIIVILYTTPSCTSCRKAKAWLKENQIDFVEREMLSHPLSAEEVKKFFV